MNIHEVQVLFTALYENNKYFGNEYFEKLVGDIRISTTQNQGLIINLATKELIMMFKDTSRYKGEQKSIIITTCGNGLGTIEFTREAKGDISIYGEIPRYLPPGTEVEQYNLDIEDIDEAFIFQQSTLINHLPDYNFWEQVLKYYPSISSINSTCNTSVVMSTATNWDNLPLREEDFQ